MGFLDADNYLWHAGRFKRFVKIGGEMVSLVRVENTLEKFLPRGVSCCVVDVTDEIRGSSIIATVTIEVNKAEILKKMGDELPNIALPKHFIVIRELPMMGTGKIDFRSVTKIVQDLLSNPEKEYFAAS
jgi:acyl-[acyl-carrier-protein]-phospholipid O-acyltransferase / long-chain-fatty-acid--[acyl-carrier-protein] ligase